jgi:RimJ/RimL family protein N-acetyltransferase
MSAPDLRPVYLRGRGVYLRAMVKDDKERGTAWYDGRLPVNAARAEKVLEEEHKHTWDRMRRRLAIVRTEDDDVVGSALVLSWNRLRTCRLDIRMAPWLQDADALRAEALGLLVHWLRDEMELMVVTVEVAADEPATIAAAEALGMAQTARHREWYGRPDGRVDCLLYQALNPRWEVRDA